MKTNLFKTPFLTKTTLLIAASLLLVVSPSCKKKDTEEPEKVITTDDAADVVSYAMESSSGGYAEQVTDGAAYVDNSGFRTSSPAGSMNLICGVPFDTTVTRSHSGTVNASYAHQCHYLLTCDAGSKPVSITYSGTYTGSYDGPRMSSSNTGNRNWVITGLDSASTTYTYSGNLTRNGSHTSKVRNQYTFTSDLQVSTSNLVVNKSTHRITGGTGTVSVTCSVSNGNSYSFAGTIVFNGNNTAALTINGNAYTITLY